MLYTVRDNSKLTSGGAVSLLGNSSDAQLILNLRGYNSSLTDASGIWPLFVGDIGDVEGSYIPVIASPNITYSGFSVYNGTVNNQLTDADQTWVGECCVWPMLRDRCSDISQ